MVMASAPDKSVKAEFLRSLANRPGSFSFFAAVRRMEQLYPDRPPVGVIAANKEPVVRFAQVPHLYFPPSELFGYTPGAAGAGTLQVYFFGFFGPNGPLPLALTDYVHTRGRQFYDLAMQRFADIFHNRLIALFYRASARTQAAISYDRPADPIGNHLAAMAGMPNLARESILPATAPVGHFHELKGKNKPAPLKNLLERFFDVPVTLLQNRPCHLPIEESGQCRLGVTESTGTLGVTALLGERQRSVTEKIALEIGPMDYEYFRDFLPDCLGFNRLKAWLHLMTDKPLIWDLQFLVKSETIPAPELNGGMVLGYNTVFPEKGKKITRYSIICSI